MKKNDKKGVRPTPVLKNPLVLTVAVTLAVLLVFTGVFGGVAIYRTASSVVHYGGSYMTPSAAAYLATTNKTAFLAKYDGYDNPDFYASEYESGVSYGDMLKSETRAYLSEVVAGAYLFDRYSVLSGDEKRMIRESAEGLLEGRNLTKREFNRAVAEMGFDFDGLVSALTLKYKAARAMSRVYGEGGAVLASGNYTADCDRYYSTYRYAKLLFIRTDYEYLTDEDGEPVRDANGNLVKRDLTAEELAERLADIAEIRDAIEALENGTDDQMNEGFFDSMLKKYDLDDYTTTGYFFSPYSDYTVGFADEVSSDVVDEVFEMELGSFGEVDTEYGLCFIYRGALISGAYASDTFEVFFTDFFEDAARTLYLENLADVAQSVTVKDRLFELVDILELPYNWEYVVREGVVA